MDAIALLIAATLNAGTVLAIAGLGVWIALLATPLLQPGGRARLAGSELFDLRSRRALVVDGTGRVIVWTGDLEKAEFKRDQIHAYGADWRIPRCKGSMSAILEPLAG